MDEKFGYLPCFKLEHKLEKELKNFTKLGSLYLSNTNPDDVHWSQNVWCEIKIQKIKSISDGVKFLKGLQKRWSLYPFKSIRRSILIQEQLAKNFKPIIFFTKLPSDDLGSWTLLDDNTILYSQKCSSLFPNGEASFVEDKKLPSRAYLKLWEIFTILGKTPGKNERCLEIGSSPGSWSYVLANLKVDLTSVDRASLDESLNIFSNINFLKQDAFSILPGNFGKVDWIFSDLVCYPEKLYSWIEMWLDYSDNFICTIKFQKDDHDHIIQKFKDISGSKILHLFNNKHELTWIRIKN